jgi:D-tyrosyl-tRNA(Tyr) deacylase
MKVVLQRVKEAYVEVNKDKIASISKGLLVFWGIEKGDSFQDAEVLIEKILKLRIFSDEHGKMNLSIKDVDGKVLIVSQFTLAGNYIKGNRPSFINADDPVEAEKMLEKIISVFSNSVETKSGQFGAMMEVGLKNDGPITFVLQAKNGQLIN